MTAAKELRRLNSTRDGYDLEVRARCQDSVGCVHPYVFGHGEPGSFCHCGRIIYAGVHPVVLWPRPPVVHRARSVFG